MAGKPKDYRMSIWGPKVVPDGFWHPTQLYVNYFLGNEFTEVEYRVKGTGSEWRRMGRAEEHDPYVAALRHEWDIAKELPEEGSRPSNPVVSTHLWKTSVPNNWRGGNLPKGEQTIEIRVSDIFGRTFNDEYIYRIVEPKYTDGHP